MKKHSKRLKPAKINSKRNLYTIDIADIVEVRKGFSTDTFNAVEKKIRKAKPCLQWGQMSEGNCFSIIFDKRARSKPLDLVSIQLNLERFN